MMFLSTIQCKNGFGPSNKYYTMEDLVNNEPVPYLEDSTEDFIFICYLSPKKNRLYIYKINKHTNEIVDYSYRRLNFII